MGGVKKGSCSFDDVQQGGRVTTLNLNFNSLV